MVTVSFAICASGAPMRSLGWALALGALFVCVVATAARRPAAAVIGLAGAAFTPWLAIRMSPWLLVIDVLAAVGLVLVAIALPAAGSISVPGHHHVTRLFRAWSGVHRGPAHLIASAGAQRRTSGSIDRLRRLAPSIAVGLVTVVVGVAVLASGDALFASFLDVGAAPEAVAPRIAAAFLGLTMFAVSLGAIAAPGVSDAITPLRAPAALPTTFAIAGLTLVIGLYGATQVSAAVLGADFVRARTGLTYAEWARSGFFQLVVVTAAATTGLVVARSVLRRQPAGAQIIRVAASLLTVGVLTTVIASIIKLVVYTETFGLTMLRLYTVIFAGWLGLVSALAAASLARPLRDWLAPAVIASVVVGAFTMNVVNPERLVAEHNISRSATTGELDVRYLDGLSLDAAPAIFENLDLIDALTPPRDDGSISREVVPPVDAATELGTSWCARIRQAEANDLRGFFERNLSRSAATDAARSACS